MVQDTGKGASAFSRSLTVLENLELGALNPKAQKLKAHNLKKVFDLFPLLEEREKPSTAGTLSGGEQQMLAIGRGLMSNPKILMLDEPSLGLSPLLVNSIFAILRQINQDGMTILLVEQNVHHSLNLAQRAYVLENGEMVREGPALGTCSRTSRSVRPIWDSDKFGILF